MRATYMVDPPFCLEAVGFAFRAPEAPLAALAALLAALRAFTSLPHTRTTFRRKTLAAREEHRAGGKLSGPSRVVAHL